jgi:hypothetical protein
MRQPELNIKRARGFLLIVAIFVLVVIAVAIAALGNMTSADIRASSGHAQSEQAYFVALSGLEVATRTLLEPTLPNRVPCASLSGDPAVTNVAVGPGKFSATGGAAVYPSPPATLNGNLTAAATVIPVNSIVGYSASGRIMIDLELIDYSATSNVAATCGAAPCFVGARRGSAGTAANAHATGTRVGQFECDVQSAGGVPDLVNAQAKRILTQGTQLHEAWAVGAFGGVGSGQRPWFVRFRENTWAELTDASLTVNEQLNKVSMLSYADGWAVGNNAPGGEVIYHWTVTPAPGWARMALSAAIPDVNLQGVHCVDANTCWAVGAAFGGNVVIIRWTGGPAWLYPALATSAPLPTPSIDEQLNSIWCNSANDCWAVGNAAAAGVIGEVILQWTGAARWTRMAPAAIPNVNLWSVNCVAANDCWAVGVANGGNVVIIRWTGGPAWSYPALATSAPLPSPSINVRLNSVFCNNANDCWAVGNFDALGEVILRWTGGPRWVRIAPSPAIANTNLNAVTCVNTIDCWAVGNLSGGSEIILHWDGSTWTQLANSALVSNRNLLSIDVIGAAQRAPAARREVYP